MNRVLIAVALAGMLSAGSGCCSCLHEAAAWRKSWSAPHVCGHSYGPFGNGCCPCGGCGSCTNQCDYSESCDSCGGDCGCGGHSGWLGRWAGDGGVDRCDPCCDDGCWDHGRCDHCGDACEDDCSMWLADDWGRGCAVGGCGGCGGGDCCPCGGGCCNSHVGHHNLGKWCLAELCPRNWFGGCKGGGCGKFYWNEWFSDPPCCYDPCNCCGEYTGQGCGHGLACGGCARCESGGGYVPGTGYTPGPGHSAGPGYGMRPRGEYHSAIASQPKQVESYAMRQPRQTASAPQRTSDVPFSFHSNSGGANVGGAQPSAPRTAVRPGAPAPRTSAKPTGKTSTRTARPQAPTLAKRKNQPAPRHPASGAANSMPQQAVEETIVEGSLKVVEDRAVQPANGQSPQRSNRPAPSSAKRRVRATRTSSQYGPTT
ncbi:MAG: hypothetical protein AB7I37_16540 [Pirellulales bacterium]